jgi:hypothetical protein
MVLIEKQKKKKKINIIILLYRLESIFDGGGGKFLNIEE